MNTIISLLIIALDIYIWLIIAGVVVSWLVAFNVLNTRNKWVYKGCGLLDRAIEPGMAQLRKVIPPMGGMDFTPMAMLVGIWIVQAFLRGLMG